MVRLQACLIAAALLLVPVGARAQYDDESPDRAAAPRHFVPEQSQQAPAPTCANACRHIEACGLNDFSTCMASCRATPEQLAQMLLASCEEILAQAQVEARQKAASQPLTCQNACRHVVECELNTFETCMERCKGVSQADLKRLMTSSCDELLAGASGGRGGGNAGGGSVYRTSGMSCVGGDRTCQGVNVCCGPNGPAGYGQRGMCQSAAICNMPRR